MHRTTHVDSNNNCHDHSLTITPTNSQAIY
jgi:hypothetical protein